MKRQAGTTAEVIVLLRRSPLGVSARKEGTSVGKEAGGKAQVKRCSLKSAAWPRKSRTRKGS